MRQCFDFNFTLTGCVRRKEGWYWRAASQGNMTVLFLPNGSADVRELKEPRRRDALRKFTWESVDSRAS